jgi:hypothetical protein
MPGLYGFTANSNVSVNVGNTTGLYQQNTGNVYVVNNAVTLLNTLSQAGNVNFALTAGNSKVLAYTANIGTVAGSYGSTTTVPVVTVTSDGRVTGITTVTIDPGAPGFYSNANVAAYLPTYTGSLANSSSIISLQANAAAQQSDITNLDAQYTSLDSTVITQGGQIGVLQANAVTQQVQIDGKANIAGQIFTGNVQAPYFIGDGSQLTGVIGTYSNTNVAALLSSNTISTINTIGNITTVANIVSPAYLYPNGVSILSGIGGTYSNTNVAAYLTTATIATTGNISANYVIGNGSLLTNLPVQTGTYSNANVTALLSSNTVSTITTTGNITAANLTTAGNVTATYILGNAASMTGLTGVAAGTYGSDTVIPAIQIDASGRIIGITSNIVSGSGSYGNANVAAYLPTYNGALPNLSSINTSGNITANAGGYFVGDGRYLTNLPVQAGTYSNTNVTAYLTTATITTSGNVTAANLTTAGNVYGSYIIGDGSLLTNLPVQAGTYSNTNVAAYLTTATINTSGNITGANLITAGNVYGNYVIGDGSQLTNLPVQAGTYSNANVASYLTTATINTSGNITGANLITAGNLTASYVLGDGSLLTNLPVQAGTYSNTNVTAYLTTATISTTGNITGANLITAGNLTASYVLGDGSLLTNLPVQAGTYSNTNVTAYLTTATISTSGNITAANLITAGNVYGSYIIGNGSLLTNLPTQAGTYSNTNVAAYLTTATISTTGNITAANLITGGNVYGSYIIGDGSLLTNLPGGTGTYSNANVASYMPVFGGNILAGNVDIPYTSGTRNRGPLAIGGNLNHYDSGVVASFQGNEATYLYTSLQNTNTGNTAYASYAVNDGSHTYYGELGINSGTYDYAAAGYPNNAFSQPYATFIQSTGANLAVGTYTNHGISFLVNGQTNTADAMTIANTGNVTVTGNLAVNTLATVGNIKSTSGYFWANAAVYDGFSGDLGSRSLIATGIGRVFANAAPQTAVTQISSYTQGVVVNTTPVYTAGNLTMNNQTIGMVNAANVAFLTSYAAGTRTTNLQTAYLGLTATSANATMNPNDRFRAYGGSIDMNLNGKNWGALTSASNTQFPILINGQTMNIYGTGQVGQAAGISNAVTLVPINGSISAQYMTGYNTALSFNTAGGGYTTSNVQTARLYTGFVTGVTGNLTINNAIALHTFSGWVSSNVSLVTNAYTILNEDTRSVIQTAGNIVATTTSNVILGQGQMVSYRDKIQALGTTSGSITLNGNVAPSWTITLDNTLTLSNSTFTNYASGASVTLIITQDGTGGRTLSTSQIKWAGASSTLSTAAGAIDIANFYYDGTTWYGSLVKGYA